MLLTPIHKFLALTLCLTLAFAGTGAFGETDNAALLTQADLKSRFETYVATTRGAGTLEEAVFTDDLAKRLIDAGYTVRFDGFSGSQVAVGTFGSRNLIAERPVEDPNADILIVSAHLDSHLCTVGANDNATGAAAVEAIAMATAALPSDTELWFVFFSGEEEGLLGSLAFTSSISEEDRYRIIGDIQLDMLGNRYSTGYQLGIPNNEATLLSAMLSESAERVTGEKLNQIAEKMSDHVPFAIAGIPSVYFLQIGDGYENHSVLDDATMIDMDLYYQGVEIALDTVLNVMSADTTGLAASEQERLGDGGICGRVDPYNDYLDFETPLETLETGTATKFTFVSSEINEFGDEQSVYTGAVRWFNMDEALTTEAHLYRDNLDQLIIRPAEQGKTLDEMIAAMSAIMGEPQMGVNDDGLPHYAWPWYLGRSFFDLIGTADDYSIVVANGYTGNVEIESIDLDADGEPIKTLSKNGQKLWDDILSKVVSKENRAAYMARFLLFTEGLHNLTGYTPAADAETPRMTLGLDYNDIFDQNGEYRNFYKALSTTIHEYGHVLAMNETQMDLSADTASYDLPPYREDSYMVAYMNRFYPDIEPTANEFPEGSYRAHPTDFVSTYGTGQPMEDFAESFRCFVLGSEPDTATVAGQKMAFFYDYPEFVEIRDGIRADFDLDA